ncbi:MAG: hypothetical protein KY475_25305 [Planctomycetes bacterium]|nr:hypothetical protein [Planctomycetota bacterium]
MTKLLSLPDTYHLGRRVHGFFDDFYQYVSGDLWTLVTALDGSATVLDAAGGKVAIKSAVDTAGNEDAYLKSNKESFKFAANKPLLFEALVDFAESSTNQANVIAGLMDAVAADALVNDGAGPKSSYSGAVFYKVDGETVWRCESSIGSSQVTTTTEVTAGGATAQRLTIEFQPLTSTTGEVRFYIDDELAAKHAITFTSATEMQVILGVKDGDLADEETLNVDYAACYQLR